MIIDIHAHLLSPHFSLADNKLNFWNKLLYWKLGIKDFASFSKKMIFDLKISPVDKVVLCAVEGTPLAANNQETLAYCKRCRNFLYAPNLNPLSKNFKDDINEAVMNDAVLVKVLPSFQCVDLSDERCRPFFKELVKYKLPLLVHTGVEHTFKGNNNLNNPLLLEKAAQMGVTIICAHCGCPMMLHEKSFFKEWIYLAKKYPNVYGDVSGFSGYVRHLWLSKILKDPSLKDKILFGTDCPSFPYLFRKTHNMFSDWVDFFRKEGCSEEFFLRSERILNAK